MKGAFEKSSQGQSEKAPEKRFVDPAADGWEKRPDGAWIRRTDTGFEYLGMIAPKGTLTPDQVRAYYNRRKELERRVQEGNKDASKELESVNRDIGYLERYGPGVMGGE
ncbi:MAG: hypothetical protein ABSE18_02750 [Minisyncoccia bacterium]|jgi:tetrahydromethanopterin S-methyltransferase subunit G